jgi:threonine dehydrogenase-like Zn-dependent dehydrogenase
MKPLLQKTAISCHRDAVSLSPLARRERHVDQFVPVPCDAARQRLAHNHGVKMPTVHAYGARERGGPLHPFEYELWAAYINALAPRGRLHTVGVMPGPVSLNALSMNPGQKSFSGSPVGSPVTIQQMLDFCGRHGIAPKTEQFAMSDVNQALDHLRSGKARHRVVLRH